MASFLVLFAFSAKAQDITTKEYIDRCREYAATNSWHEVKRTVDEGLQNYPDNPELRYYNGRYYYITGNIQEARYQLVRATQEDDQHYRSKRLLVDVEEDLKHYSSAICYINELLEFQPYDRDLWRRKIHTYRKMGNHVEADAALQRLSQIYPNDTIVRNELRNRNRENWNQVLQKNTLKEAADNLEQWIDIDAKVLEYYVELTSLYERMGEYERALGAVNRGLVHFPHNQQLVSKALGIMTSMGLYAQALTFAKQNGGSQQLYANLLHEVADDARLRDPYEANGRLYALTHDADALHYLINTSLTRGYHEDARYYLREAVKRDGETPDLLAKLYSLEKTCGNDHAALRYLQSLYDHNPADTDLRETYATELLAEAVKAMEGEQWAEADLVLQSVLALTTPAQEQWSSAVSRRIVVLGHLNKHAEARRLYQKAADDYQRYASSLSSSDNVLKDSPVARFADAYEAIAAPRLRALMEEENYEEAMHEARGLLEVVPRSEAALRTCINASQTLHRDDLFHTYAQEGYEAYPESPYFIIKRAVSLRQQGHNAEALTLLQPVSNGSLPAEWVNPQLIAAHSGISSEWAGELIKQRMPDVALAVIDSALVRDHNNRELLYLKGVAYEHLKDWSNAYRYESRYYEPSNAELQEYREHMRYLGFRALKNRVDVDYTHAAYDTKSGSLSTRGHLYSRASLTYSRLQRRDTYTAQVSYKGIDGYHYYDEETDYSEDEPGGVGLEFMAQWEHTFNSRWSAMINATASTRYFNRFGANISASYAANHGWTPTLRLGYRRTPKTYLFLGSPSDVSSRNSEYNLFLVSPSVEKAWERIRASLGMDLTVMEGNLYYNVGAKGKLFFNDDQVSSVSLLAGFGSFPELSFFDNTALQGLSHTNAMVGLDAQYLVTRHLVIGIAGSWNTCYNPIRNADGSLVDSYRNIYSITAQIHVAF